MVGLIERIREDSQLAGVLVVDTPGATASDRIFMLGVWRNDVSKPLSQYVPVINGKSWSYTERLTYNAGDQVRWRLINASDSPHPMHMHGSYYRVDSVGDGERDQIFPPAQQRWVVTQVVEPGETMTTFWVPPAGKWIFHCHFLIHTSPEMTVADALGAQTRSIAENDADHPENGSRWRESHGRHGARHSPWRVIVLRQPQAATPGSFGCSCVSGPFAMVFRLDSATQWRNDIGWFQTKRALQGHP